MRFPLHSLAVVLLVFATSAPVAAQDNEGCQKFAWPLTRERAWLAALDKAQASDGDTLAAMPKAAVSLKLHSGSEAKFVQPPERKPRGDNLYGGSLKLPAPSKAGLYQITLSEDAWVDAIQGGQYLRSAGSTGRRDCAGLRKSVRIILDTTPLTLQFSSVENDAIGIVITPVE